MNQLKTIQQKLQLDCIRGKNKNYCQGHIHTDVLMKEVIKKEYGLLGKTRLSHIWHMTLNKDDKPLIITDGALNVIPNL